MKNLIVVMTMLLCFTAFTQEGKHRPHHKRVANDMTAEQLATLKTKKMVLALTLNSKQQKEVFKVNLKTITFRKAKMTERKKKHESGTHKKLSADEKFKLQSAILDQQIAQQERFKEILTDEQFILWKKTKNRKGTHKKNQKTNRRG